jgi:NTE family protein
VSTRRPRVGLALAGGGPLGAVYEIGALCALEEAVAGLNLSALDGYVGVSAGGFVAAGLASGMSPRALCAAFVETGPGRADAIDPSLFVRPAWGEFARRAAAVPRLVAQAAYEATLGRRSALAAAERIGRALPTGMFSNGPLEQAMARLLSGPGRTDDFREMPHRLVLVATDLDSGEAAPFGLPGWDHVPISRAIAASAALPGLYPPVCIDGHWYVDGALKKTLHASVLLELSLDLVVCLNPLVPFDASHARHRVPSLGRGRIPRLVEGGLPVVMSQTFRSMIHSRLQLGLKSYEAAYPGTDVLLFEPDHRDPEMFLSNIFSYSQRQHLAEHAYQQTRADLRSRRSVLRRTLSRHGLELDDAVLDDTRRTLMQGRRAPAGGRTGEALRRLDEVLDDLERALALRERASATQAVPR